jgi:signal transduction histidine kinase
LLVGAADVELVYEQMRDVAIALMRADFASIQRMSADGSSLRLLAWRGFHSESARYWETVGFDGYSTCAEVLRTGARYVVYDVEQSGLIAGSPDLDEFRRSGIRSVQSTALISRSGRHVGVMSTQWRQPYEPPSRHLNRFDVLTRQVADLIERRQNEELLRHSEARKAFLLRLSDVLRPLEHPFDVQAVACRLLGEQLDVDRAYYGDVHVDDGVTIVRLDYHREGLRSIAGSFAHDRLAEPSAALKSGQPLVIDSVERSPQLSEVNRSVYRGVGFGSFISVPILKAGRFVGTLTVVGAPDRGWTPDEVTLVQDVAERTWEAIERARLLEVERKSRQLAEEAVQVRDEFLSVAAHELKTPVTTLLGFAQILRRQIERHGKVNPDQPGRAIQAIEQQSARLSRLVSQLLDTSRIGEGRLALERVPHDLVPLVEEVAAAARLSAAAHPLLVKTPAKVVAYVDPLRVEQVLTNLVDNAIRYSPEGGLVEIALTDHAHELGITVRDHGIGIPSEHLPRVFDRFYRAHEGRGIAGPGLGLYISREIVTLHGGQIDVECPADGGTRFVVTLPIGSVGAEDDGTKQCCAAFP